MTVRRCPICLVPKTPILPPESLSRPREIISTFRGVPARSARIGLLTRVKTAIPHLAFYSTYHLWYVMKEGRHALVGSVHRKADM